MRTMVGTAKSQVTILFWIVVLLWVIELVDLLVFRRQLDRYGIRPLNPSGLIGIPLAPFLHGGLGHLLANTFPLVFLGWLIMLRRIADFFAVAAFAILIGGLGTWLFGGPGTIHIGASGVVFGFLGYLLLRGYFERSFTSIALAVVVGLLYGGALWGLLPGVPGISWQGHLFGFMGGGTAARAMSGRRSSGRSRIM
jgi:membrane associated rhomboid family serine protease